MINAPGRNIENFMKDVYRERYEEDVSDDFIKHLRSIAVSIFAIGGMLGGFSGGWMANRFGRKGGLLLNNVFGIAGACLMGFTKISRSYEILFLGRFIIGLNCGMSTLFKWRSIRITCLLVWLSDDLHSESTWITYVFLSLLFRFEHVAGTNVYIWNSTVEFAWWSWYR